MKILFQFVFVFELSFSSVKALGKQVRIAAGTSMWGALLREESEAILVPQWVAGGFENKPYLEQNWLFWHGCTR